MVLELLLADMPEAAYTRATSSTELPVQAGSQSPSRVLGRAARGRPVSHPAIAVNLDACIQCTRCLRACRDEQVNDVIGLAFRGEHAKIVFDTDAMGVVDLRRLRRMRAGLPDRRADAGARGGLAAPDRQVESRSARSAAWAAS